MNARATSSLLAVLALSSMLAGCGSGSQSASTGPQGKAAGGAEQPAAGVAGETGAAGDMQAGSQASVADANRLTALRTDARAPGFELVTQPKRFEFPRDHGPHPEFRHEWWYVTGHLDSASGEPFGFELTFFRFGLKRSAPGDAASREGASAWRSNQIYMAHFAVTDIDRKTFHVAERFSRDALGLAGATSDPFRVSLEGWSLAEQGAIDVPQGLQAGRDAAAPREGAGVTSAEDRGAAIWRLVAADGSYALDLNIDASSPVMLNGDAGLSRKSSGEGAASYYYSMPTMPARGRLMRDGKAHDVKGTVWLDREWGSGALSGDQQGWDWFALQLEDGSALMFYALRSSDSKRDPHSAGTWLAPDGTMRALANEDVEIEVKDQWTSPRGVSYPSRWQLRVRSLKLDVDIEPRLANQELNTSTRYWEGACTVTGTRDDKPIAGKAYVELVGYTAR